MSELLTNYITVYGYLAIFCLIFLQESGVPGLPNEMVLFYFGYISRQNHLLYPVVVSIVTVADILGSFFLYSLFYYLRSWLIRLKPSWISVPVNKIDLLKKKMTTGYFRAILIGKLTPFIRSYIPVVAGIMKVQPLPYAKVIICTAIIWSGGWITVGWLFAGL